MIKENGILVKVNSDDIELLETPEGRSEFWKGVKEIGTNAFSSLRLTRIQIPKTVKEIQDGAFCDCPFLRQFILNSKDTKINSRFIRSNKNFTHIYIKENGEYYKLNTLAFDYGYEELNKYNIKNLSKVFDVLYKDCDYTSLGVYLTFAQIIGCFSCEQIKLKKGNIVNLSDYATEIFLDLYKNARNHFNRIPRLDGFIEAFKNENLFNFLQFIKNNSDGYQNFKAFTDCARDMYVSYYDVGQYYDLINDFDRIHEFKNKNMTYSEAYLAYLNSKKYNKLDADKWNIYERLQKNNVFLNEKEYTRLVEVVAKQKKNKIPEHILGYELKDPKLEILLNQFADKQKKSSKDRIEDLQKQTDLELSKAKDNIEFAFEMLSKHDLVNGFIGKLKTSCCSSLVGKFDYGVGIAEGTMLDPDIQNLVVRDRSKDIIAKATMYVDRENGNILINSFQINSMYKKPGKIGAKQKIYDTFMEGIKSFVGSYNLNPENKVKIKQVNVGADRNLLSEQIKSKKIDCRNENFLYCKDKCFDDAKDEQHVLLSKTDIKKLKTPTTKSK